MALNAAAMTVAANSLRTAMAYAQLHSGLAGAAGTTDVTSAPRQPVTWAAVTALGSFSLSAQIAFTGGAPGGTVYSVTLWSASSGGTFYGELPLTGDLIFNGAGGYFVTAIDFTGTVA